MDEKLYLCRRGRVTGPYCAEDLGREPAQPGDMVSTDLRNWVPREKFSPGDEESVSIRNGPPPLPATAPPFRNPSRSSSFWTRLALGMLGGVFLVGAAGALLAFLASLDFRKRARAVEEVQAIVIAFQQELEAARNKNSKDGLIVAFRTYGHRLAAVDSSQLPKDMQVAVRNTSSSAIMLADATERLAHFEQQTGLIAFIVFFALESPEGLGATALEWNRLDEQTKQCSRRFYSHHNILVSLLEKYTQHDY